MSYNSQNLFAKIIRKEIPCNKFYEDERVIAFYDISPVAPIHILVLPKGEYISFDDFVSKAAAIDVANFFQTIQKIANQAGVVANGYRLIMNHGANASQTIDHFHVHIIAGKALGGLISTDKHIR
jgi:histidine triad (HIT) family protein